jgi:hypothetical protein
VVIDDLLATLRKEYYLDYYNHRPEQVIRESYRTYQLFYLLHPSEEEAEHYATVAKHYRETYLPTLGRTGR